MPRDGSGGYSRTHADYVPNTTISAADINGELNDIASALTASLAKDGQTVATAAIPFAAGLNTNTISERTSASGVTVDGVLLKDGGATLKDSVTQFQDDGDATKQLRFQLSGITTATTRTATWPDADITVVGIAATQTLTNKTLSDSTTYFADNSDATKLLQFQISGITTGTTRTATWPDADLTVVGLATSQTLTNKTLTSPVLNTGVSGTALAATSDLAAGTATLLVTAATIKRYTTTGQTIAANTTLTLAHGLGAKPFFVQLSIVMGASTEGGFAEGDEVLIGPNDMGSSSADGIFSVLLDATNVTVVMANAASSIVLANKSTRAAFTIDNTKWTLTVRASL